MAEREILTQERVQQIVDGSKVDPNGYEFAQLARLALKSFDPNPARALMQDGEMTNAEIDELEKKAGPPEGHFGGLGSGECHKLFAAIRSLRSQLAQAQDAAMIEAMRNLQAPQFQPAPPSDVVEADLAKNWAAFCDADNFVGAHDFPDRMEAAGLIELVPVDDDALDDAFAADRGIVKGGNMWVLSEQGRAAIEAITRLGVKGE